MATKNGRTTDYQVYTGVDFADEKWLQFTDHRKYAWENKMSHIMPLMA